MIKPSRASIDHVRNEAKAVLHKGQHAYQAEMIRTLNPILRGWGNYFRHVVSKVIFQELDQAIWRLTWNWARRRHPQKSRRWVKERYFPRQGNRKWTFSDGQHTLVSLAYIPIRRHVLVRSRANPYNPKHSEYWERGVRSNVLPHLLVRSLYL
nr:group II intron maturase-specific domain-containing protein [Ectothiorhodospira shaposhnikovii]